MATPVVYGDQPIAGGTQRDASASNLLASGVHAAKVLGVPDTVPLPTKHPERTPLAEVLARDNSVARKQYDALRRYANRVTEQRLGKVIGEDLLAQGIAPEEATLPSARAGAEKYVLRRIAEQISMRRKVIETGQVQSAGALWAMLRPINKELEMLRCFAAEQTWQVDSAPENGDAATSLVAILSGPIPESTDEAEIRLVQTLITPSSKDLLRAQIRYVLLIDERFVREGRDTSRMTGIWELLVDATAPKSMLREQLLDTVRESKGGASSSVILSVLLGDAFDECPLSDTELRRLLGTMTSEVIATGFGGRGVCALLKRYPWLENLDLPDDDPLRRLIASARKLELVADPVEAEHLFNGARREEDDARRLATLKAYGADSPVPPGLDVGRWALDTNSPIELRLAAVEVLAKSLKDSVNQRKTRTKDVVRTAHMARQQLQRLVIAQGTDDRVRIAASKVLTADRQRCALYRDRLRSELEGIVRTGGTFPTAHVVRYVLENLYALHMDYVAKHANQLPGSLADFGGSWSNCPTVDRCAVAYIPAPPWDGESQSLILAFTTNPYERDHNATDRSDPRVVSLLLTDGRICEVDRSTFEKAWRVDVAGRAALGYDPVVLTVLGAAGEWIAPPQRR